MPRLLHISLCVLFSTIVLRPQLSTFSGILVAAFWLIFVLKRKCVFENKSLIVATIFFLILYVLSWVMNFHSREHSFEVEKRVALLLLIPFFTKEFIDSSKVKTYMILFCVSVFAVQIMSLYNILLWMVTIGDLNLSVGYDVGKVLFLHRPYLGFFVLISSIITYLFIKYGASKNWIALVFFNILFVGYIGARAALLLHVLGALYLFLTEIRSIKVWKPLLLGGSVVILFGIGLVSQKQRFSDFRSGEPRFFIWEMASNVFNDKGNAVFGFFDEVQLQKELDVQYNLHAKNGGKYYWVYDEALHWNSHNQYIDVFLAYGAIGLMIVLLLLVSFMKVAWVTKEKSVFFLVSSFFLFLVVENVFARQWGVFIFSCIIPMVFLLSQYLKKSSVLSPNVK